MIVGCHYPLPLLHTAPCFSCRIFLPLSALSAGCGFESHPRQVCVCACACVCVCVCVCLTIRRGGKHTC